MFGNQSGRTGSTDIDHRYRGEQVDPNTGFYNLRARWYDPSTGRFMSQDSWIGRSSDPVSLHKYLYANSEPVNNVDPSGHMTMGELNISQSVMSMLQTSLRIGSSAINAYDKIDSLITLVQLGQGAGSAMQLIKEFAANQSGASEHGFINAMKNPDEASISLSRNFAWILSQMATPKKENQIKEFIRGPKNKFLIYGPTPYLRSTPWLPPGTRIFVGKLRLSKGSRDIEIELGRGSGQGGRVLGIGHSYANQKNQGSQWWRMDWHSPHGTGSNDRIDGDYHFHTQTAP